MKTPEILESGLKKSQVASRPFLLKLWENRDRILAVGALATFSPAVILSQVAYAGGTEMVPELIEPAANFAKVSATLTGILVLSRGIRFVKNIFFGSISTIADIHASDLHNRDGL